MLRIVANPCMQGPPWHTRFIRIQEDSEEVQGNMPSTLYLTVDKEQDIWTLHINASSILVPSQPQLIKSLIARTSCIKLLRGLALSTCNLKSLQKCVGEETFSFTAVNAAPMRTTRTLLLQDALLDALCSVTRIGEK